MCLIILEHVLTRPGMVIDQRPDLNQKFSTPEANKQCPEVQQQKQLK